MIPWWPTGEKRNLVRHAQVFKASLETTHIICTYISLVKARHLPMPNFKSSEKTQSAHVLRRRGELEYSLTFKKVWGIVHTQWCFVLVPIQHLLLKHIQQHLWASRRPWCSWVGIRQTVETIQLTLDCIFQHSLAFSDLFNYRVSKQELIPTQAKW